MKEYGKKYRARYREKNRVLSSIYHKKVRLVLYDILGHSCVKCGFNDKRALQIDHINGGGTKELQVRFKKSSRAMYYYYARNPEEAIKSIQILCANCNWIKRYKENEVRKPLLKLE